MSWLSDAWDWGTSLFDSSSDSGSSGGSSSGGSWIDRNWDTISKIAGSARDIYNNFDVNSNRQGSRNDILNFLKQSEAQDNDYQRQLWEYKNRASAANAAAARANDAARRKASKKAFKKQSKMLQQLIAQYQPYADAAKALTPKMQENYSQYLDTTALLNQYLTPKVMESLTATPKPTWEINPPKARFAVSMPQGAPISFKQGA